MSPSRLGVRLRTKELSLSLSLSLSLYFCLVRSALSHLPAKSTMLIRDFFSISFPAAFFDFWVNLQKIHVEKPWRQIFSELILSGSTWRQRLCGLLRTWRSCWCLPLSGSPSWNNCGAGAKICRKCFVSRLLCQWSIVYNILYSSSLCQNMSRFVYRPLLHSCIDLVIVVHQHFLEPIGWKRTIH